jgi:hypothetical protein
VSLSDKIFPPPPAPDGNVLRLGLVGSWESQFLGLGRLTGFLTPRLMKQSHAVDDMGLYVAFLQRHRVEVGLKLILERAAAPIPNTHVIKDLFDACEAACKKVGFLTDWQTFAGAQGEFVDLMDEVDPGAATFRYPVDRHANPWPRRPLVDLVALEAAGEDFESAVSGLVQQLARLEPIPVSSDGAEETVAELMAVAWHARGVVRVQHETMSSLQAERARISGRRRRTPDRTVDAYHAYDAVLEVSQSLADRAEAMAQRIADHCGLAVPEPPSLVRRPPMPKVGLPLDPQSFKKQQDAQIKWIVDGLVEQMRPLGTAADAVERRAQSWSGPAARQVLLDVKRFRSRLHRAIKL